MPNFATFSKNQLDSFVDLEKTEKMRSWLQNFVSIQPRTSLEKSDGRGCAPGRRGGSLTAVVCPTRLLETSSLALRRAAGSGGGT